MTPAEIRAALHARGMSIRDLAEATGINENHLTKSLGKAGRRLQLAEVNAIEAELRPAVDDEPAIRTIPLLGEVPAGAFQASDQRTGRRVPVSDPETPANAYALTVRGDSMDLIVPDGATLIINPDDKALWPGERYIIRSADGGTTFKEFQSNPARLVPCSSNPEHKDIMLGGEPVEILGVVYSYTMRRLPRRDA